MIFKEERYEELYSQALSRFADKSDFDASEWLDEAEAKEFLKLQKAIFN